MKNRITKIKQGRYIYSLIYRITWKRNLIPQLWNSQNWIWVGQKKLKWNKSLKKRNEGCKIKRKATVKNKKDTPKLIDYDSVKKEKKPRVPRTKRPRIKMEKKDEASIFIPKEVRWERDPCTIQIYKQDYTHLDDWETNRLFRDFNTFCQLTFKNKNANYEFPHIKHLAKKFGININTKVILEDVRVIYFYIYLEWV